MSAIQGLLLTRMEGQSGISELSVILWLSAVGASKSRNETEAAPTMIIVNLRDLSARV